MFRSQFAIRWQRKFIPGHAEVSLNVQVFMCMYVPYESPTFLWPMHISQRKDDVSRNSHYIAPQYCLAIIYSGIPTKVKRSKNNKRQDLLKSSRNIKQKYLYQFILCITISLWRTYVTNNFRNTAIDWKRWTNSWVSMNPAPRCGLTSTEKQLIARAIFRSFFLLLLSFFLYHRYCTFQSRIIKRLIDGRIKDFIRVCFFPSFPMSACYAQCPRNYRLRATSDD